MPDTRETPHSCTEETCGLSTTRRGFLRDSFLAVTAALVAVGMKSTSAFAMPLQFVDGLRAHNVITYPVPAADGAQIDKGNDVILVRWKNAVYAFNLSCPHQNTALRWEESDHNFQCPKHHSRFQADGQYIPDSGRATRNMDRFAISHDASGLKVDVDKLYQDDLEAALWTAAMVKLA